MKKSVAYAAILSGQCPPELLALLEGYIFAAPNVLFLLSWSVEQTLHFVELELVHKTKVAPWKVQIPISCIVAIADMSKKKNPAGFLSGN